MAEASEPVSAAPWPLVIWLPGAGAPAVCAAVPWPLVIELSEEVAPGMALLVLGIAVLCESAPWLPIVEPAVVWPG